MNKRLVTIFVVLIVAIISGLYLIYNFVYLPKNQKPGKCLIVASKYCDLLKTKEDVNGLLTITAKLPDKTKLFSPIEGDCTNGFTIYDMTGKTINGAMFKKIDTNNNKEIHYIFSLSKNYKCLTNWVKKGDYIGQVDYKTNKEFKLLIQVIKINKEGFYSNLEKEEFKKEINSLIQKLINKNEN